MINKKIKIITKILLLIFLPNYVNASVIINEIMYNPEGTDSKREWIEIKNISNDSLLITDLKFRENDINHKLEVVQGDVYLEPSELAIILTDIESFLIDYPSYNGTIIDTSFSLTNSGEELMIVNKNDEIIDSVVYTDSLGANGDGTSLQLSDNVFINSNPTPGLENNLTPENYIDIDKGTTTTDFDVNISSHSEIVSLIDVPFMSNLKISAGRERVVSINSPVLFRASFENNRKTSYWWSFGDNNREKGLEVENIYKHPGVYNVVLTAVSRKDQAVSRTKVKVIEPELKVILEDDYYKLVNNSKNEVNLSGFYLDFGKLKKEIVENTILDPGQALYFDKNLSSSTPKLFYPNSNEYTY